MEGYGVYYYSNGDKYKGLFSKGLYNEYGYLLFANGELYLGEWDMSDKEVYWCI